MDLGFEISDFISRLGKQSSHRGTLVMKYERFEELPVWQAAADLAANLLCWTTQSWFRGKGDLANQLQRSALSISNNIAEGFERGSTKELLQFLYIARGSAGEVRSMLAVMDRMLSRESAHQSSGMRLGNDNLKSQISGYSISCEGISRQIRGWANSLQNSSIEGPRHLNDQTRQEFKQRQEQVAFQQRLDAINEETRKKREADQLNIEPRPEEDSAGTAEI